MGIKALATIHTKAGVFKPGQVLTLKNSKLTAEQAKELVDRGFATPVDDDEDDK